MIPIDDDENDDCDINNKSLFRNDDDYEPKFTKSKWSPMMFMVLMMIMMIIYLI